MRKWHLGQPLSVGQYDALLHWFQAFDFAVKVFGNATEFFDNAIKAFDSDGGLLPVVKGCNLGFCERSRWPSDFRGFHEHRDPIAKMEGCV